jgi:hypothetical protein
MKIIDLAICVNNIDPKGIGRIRCVRYNDYVGEKEKAMDYVEWGDRDPFIANPFLPSNINMIPEVGQSVKIINYSTDKETVNQEYIAGPFTTMFDYNSQTFSQQIEQTSYGVAVKHKEDIREKTGEYKGKSKNVFAKESDFGLYGKYGSDIIFTENGIQFRGGKLLSKDAASPTNRKKMISLPILADKSAKLFLKKFPKKGELKKNKKQVRKTETKDLKYIVEYDVDSLTSPTLVKFFVYQVVKTFGQTFKTNFFTESSPLILPSLKLINSDNTLTTPTFTSSVTSIDSAYKEIRDKIFTLHDKNLKEIDKTYSDEDLHPFYFRPSESFNNRVPSNSTESENKIKIYNKVKISTVGPGSGLMWSVTSVKPPVKISEIIEDVLKIKKDSQEQSFSALLSDRVFFLSTDANKGNPPCSNCPDSIDFNSLDQYELSQDDYLKIIEPSTYSTVRGENLLRLLRQIIVVLFTHKHNINKPIESQPDDAEGQILKDLLKTVETDILNKSIRIN